MSTLQVSRARVTSTFGRLQVAAVRVTGPEPAKTATLQVSRVSVTGSEVPKISTLQISRLRVMGASIPPTLQVSRIRVTGAAVTVSENLGFYLFLDGALIPLRVDWFANQQLTPLGNNA